MKANIDCAFVNPAFRSQKACDGMPRNISSAQRALSLPAHRAGHVPKPRRIRRGPQTTLERLDTRIGHVEPTVAVADHGPDAPVSAHLRSCERLVHEFRKGLASTPSQCAHHLRIPLRRDLFDGNSPIRSQNMETTKSDPLKCCECEGVLLPDRAIPLKETWVLRYVCIDCKGRSYAVKMGPAVRMYP